MAPSDVDTVHSLLLARAAEGRRMIRASVLQQIFDWSANRSRVALLELAGKGFLRAFLVVNCRNIECMEQMDVTSVFSTEGVESVDVVCRYCGEKSDFLRNNVFVEWEVVEDISSSQSRSSGRSEGPALLRRSLAGCGQESDLGTDSLGTYLDHHPSSRTNIIFQKGSSPVFNAPLSAPEDQRSPTRNINSGDGNQFVGDNSGDVRLVNVGKKGAFTESGDAQESQENAQGTFGKLMESVKNINIPWAVKLVGLVLILSAIGVISTGERDVLLQNYFRELMGVETTDTKTNTQELKALEENVSAD